MKDQVVKTIAYISLIIFLYLVSYYLYNGIFIQKIPLEGDSIGWHIPIAKFVLNGTILNPYVTNLPQLYPGASELILALFMLAGLPLNTYNVLAWFLLFLGCFFIARTFGLEKYYSILFAITVGTQNAILRWLNTQIIDIWLAVFFIFSIILLEKPKKELSYFLKLGFLLGMLLGTKYTGVLLVLSLVIFYYKKIIKVISFSRALIFLIPFSIFGLSWYIRNFLIFQNPFFPIEIFPFKGVHLFTSNAFLTSLNYPLQMLNAFISEYKLWAFVILGGVILFFHIYRKKRTLFSDIQKLILLSFAAFVTYPFSPASYQVWIMVSSIRYTYITFTLLILAVFIYAAKINKQRALAYFAIGNMILLHPVTYYPKLIFFYLPIAFVMYLILEKKIKFLRKD
ncbi:MAG: hypothetical protein AAB531_00650 [Patescibacteria group bacterium]